MATIASAKEKYAQKLKFMPENYNKGMSNFFGSNVSGSIPAKSYGAVMKPGKENDWERKLRQSFGV